MESTLWGKVQRTMYSNASHSDRDQFLHFVRPRAQCVSLLRSRLLDISALHHHCSALFGTLSPSVQVLWGRWPFDVCLTQVCQGPSWSTLVTKSHPGPPLSTQVYPISTRSSKVYPGLLRSSKDYMVRPRRRSASCLGQGWRVLVVLQFCKRNDCDQRLDFARLQTNDHTLQRRARSPQQLWAGKRGEAATWMMSLLFVQLNSSHPPTQLFN